MDPVLKDGKGIKASEPPRQATARPLGEALASKISPSASYDKLESLFPAVAALKGMDQKTPYHSLTADMHTKEAAKRLVEQPVFQELSADERVWVILGAHLHDIGKGHPDGRQENTETGRVMYSGHEIVSATLAQEEILPHLDLSSAGAEFVLSVVRNHGIVLRLMEAFEHNDQPKGGELAAYETFVASVATMQNSDSPAGRLRNLRLMIAFSRADVSATVNEDTASANPQLVERIKADLAVLDRLEKALPAIIEALEQKQQGRQKAGVVCEGGVYKYKDFDARIAYDTKGLSQALRDAGIHPRVMGILQKAQGEELTAALNQAGFEPQQIETIIRIASAYKQ